MKWPLLLFCFALAVRVGYLYESRAEPGSGYFNFYFVQGEPFGDPLGWHWLADHLAEGRGIPFWKGRRPFYCLLLSLFYVWTGPQYDLAVALNVVTGAWTVALVYQILARLFRPLVGLAVALWLTVYPEALSCTGLTLSETLGLWFLAWHVWELLCALDNGSHARMCWSGLLFGLSNITRTLTLLALPLEVLCVGWLRRQAGGSRWQSAVSVVALGAGTTLAVLPAMVVNEVRNGIFTISDNTALDLYAATHPEMGHWQPDFERQIVEKGLVTVEQQYDYFMQQAKQNIAAHPGLVFARIRRNFWLSLQSMHQLPPWLPGLLLLGLLVSTSRFRPVTLDWWLRGAGMAVALWVCFAGASLIEPTALGSPTPGRGWQLLANVSRMGVIFWTGLVVWQCRREPVLVLAVLLLPTLLAISLFGTLIPRLYLMCHWLYAGLYAGALGVAWQVVAARWLQVPRPAEYMSRAVPWRWGVWPVTVCVLFCGVSLARIGHRTWHETRFPKIPEAVAASEITQRVAAIQQATPELLAPVERQALAKDEAWLLPLELRDPVKHNGRLVAVLGRLDNVYYFPPGVRTNTDWRLFAHRDYARSVCYFHTEVPVGVYNNMELVFPGDLRPLRPGNYLLLARINGEPKSMFEALVFEGLALYRWDPALDALESEPLVRGSDSPPHRALLAALAGGPRLSSAQAAVRSPSSPSSAAATTASDP